MRRKLLITLTTLHGTRQITLGQVARYTLLILLLVAAGAFGLSNYLLMRATDSLQILESEHLALSSEYDQLNSTLDEITGQRDLLEEERAALQARYQEALGSQQVYLGELDQLSGRLDALAQDRQTLQQKMERISAERKALEQEMKQLAEARLEDSELMGQQVDELDALARERETLETQNELLAQRLTELGATLGLSKQLEGLDAAATVALIEARARERKLLLNMIPNGLPAQFERVNSDFGSRVNPVTKKKSQHNGVDLKMAKGTPVFATADGIVETSGTDTQGGFGKIIRIQHGFGFRTYYAHLNKLLVKSGEYVVKGQQIAESGNTGRSTGPHLHYEVRQLWTSLDPAPFMSWSLDNYEQLFQEVGEVAWDSLGKQYPLRMATAASQ